MASDRIELKDITPKKAFHFLRSKWRKRFGGIRIQEEDVIEFAEIIMYRALSCPKCVLDGKCTKPEGCGCPTTGLMSSMGSNCGLKAGARWDALPEKGWKEAWIKYRDSKGILFNKLYTK